MNKCDCKRIIGSETYWNGSLCVLAEEYGEDCDNPDMCQVLTQNTHCDEDFQICSCEQFEYFDTTNDMCEEKKFFNHSCSQPDGA